MTTTPRMLSAGLYAIQTHDTTHIMVKVEGDKPICIAAYARAVVEEADTLTCFAIGGPPKAGNIVGVSVMLQSAEGVLQVAEAAPEKKEGDGERTSPPSPLPNRKARRAAAKRK